MRPVDRGDPPTSIFAKYQDAKPHLEARIGRYCSFCERRQASALAVEHVQPKIHHGQLELEWDNFLLACTNCNSCKGTQNIGLAESLWPHRNNTALAFSYRGGLVRNLLPLNHPAYALADTLMAMVGLDKYEAHPDITRRPKSTDKRASDRRRIWNEALRCQQLLEATDTAGMREVILTLAKESGYFSIWFEVFSNDSAMRLALIQAFPGTAQDCFDNGQAIPKPGAPL